MLTRDAARFRFDVLAPPLRPIRARYLATASSIPSLY